MIFSSNGRLVFRVEFVVSQRIDSWSDYSKRGCGILSYPPTPPFPSAKAIQEAVRVLEGKEGKEIIANYMVDLLTRRGYLLDKQINAVDEEHKREGGCHEKLLKKRLEYRRS